MKIIKTIEKSQGSVPWVVVPTRDVPTVPSTHFHMLKAVTEIPSEELSGAINTTTCFTSEYSTAKLVVPCIELSIHVQSVFLKRCIGGMKFLFTSLFGFLVLVFMTLSESSLNVTVISLVLLLFIKSPSIVLGSSKVTEMREGI